MFALAIAARPPMTDFASWLQQRMNARGINRSQLAAFIHTRPSTVGAWFLDDRIPRPELCLRLAEYLHVPVEDVLRAAGHLPPVAAGTEAATSSLPGELAEHLAMLTPEELDSVDALARGLLLLREEKARYGDPLSRPEEASPPPPAPRRQPGKRPPK